jgi:hypothetical protein
MEREMTDDGFDARFASRTFINPAMLQSSK